jgi:hypothetical protein
MDNPQIAALLASIERRLVAHGELVDIDQATLDILNTYGQISQLREVVQRLLEFVREHDDRSARERQEIKDLLVQVHDLLREKLAAE